MARTLLYFGMIQQKIYTSRCVKIGEKTVLVWSIFVPFLEKEKSTAHAFWPFVQSLGKGKGHSYTGHKDLHVYACKGEKKRDIYFWGEKRREEEEV